MLKIDNLNEIIEFSKSLNVLYVEDNEETSIQGLKLLKNFFENITLAYNGLEGLKEFEENRFDLILSDINMPKLDGLSMIEKIREKDRNISCLIVSAHDETLHFTQAIKLGVNGFLLKPIQYELFIETMVKVITSIQVSKALKDIEEKNKKLSVLGQMMDSIAHQWKQPLSLIAMVPTNLEAKIQNGIGITNEDITYSNTIIKNQTDHLIETVNDFRTFFHPRDDQKIVIVKDVITSVLSIMHVILVKENINIDTTYPKDIKINMIPSELKHIFINLINNSKDAFLGIKRKQNKNINIDISENENKVIIDYRDNAGGIALNIIDNIFDLDFTTKEEYLGTGTGLYLVKQIVEKYDGVIQSKNINEGINFTIYFNK